MRESFFFTEFKPQMYLDKFSGVLKAKYISVRQAICLLVKVQHSKYASLILDYDEVFKMARQEADFVSSGISLGDLAIQKLSDADQTRLGALDQAVKGIPYLLCADGFYTFAMSDVDPLFRGLSDIQLRLLDKPLLLQEVIDYALRGDHWFRADWLKNPDSLISQPGGVVSLTFTPETARFAEIAISQKAFVEGFMPLLKRKTAGAQTRHGKYDQLIASGVWYMVMALNDPKVRCRCRHNKLSDIALRNAKDLDGRLIIAKCAEPKVLEERLKEQASSLVPVERRYGPKAKSPEYDVSECNCPVDWHQEWVVKRDQNAK